jgi:hypothetical protein
MHRVVHIFNIVIGKGSCSLCYLVNDPSAIMKKHRSRDTAIAWVQPGNIGRTGEEETSLDILGYACPRLAETRQPYISGYASPNERDISGYASPRQPHILGYASLREPDILG